MAKRSRTPAPSTRELGAGEVAPRQPCPCGSGKRYKNCHGAASSASPYVARPFEGLAGEAEIVALRELVPAATARVRVEGHDGEVLLCTLLPMAAPAMVRPDGTIWLGLQVQHGFGDPSRDLGAVLEKALVADPGELVGLTAAPGPGPRLQELLVDGPVDVHVHDGFDFWVADVEDPDGSVASSLDSANAAVHPTERLGGLGAAYWTDVGPKEHLRWVMSEPEDRLLDALARVHAADADTLVEGGRLVGMFRAHGVLAPVWDLPLGTGAAALQEPAEAYRAALDEALASTEPLTTEERSARAGLANRQVTLR